MGDSYRTDKAQWLMDVEKLLNEGMSDEQIAKHYGISPKTMWSRLSRCGYAVKTVWRKRAMVSNGG